MLQDLMQVGKNEMDDLGSVGPALTIFMIHLLKKLDYKLVSVMGPRLERDMETIKICF